MARLEFRAWVDQLVVLLISTGIELTSEPCSEAGVDADHVPPVPLLEVITNGPLGVAPTAAHSDPADGISQAMPVKYSTWDRRAVGRATVLSVVQTPDPDVPWSELERSVPLLVAVPLPTIAQSPRSVPVAAPQATPVSEVTDEGRPTTCCQAWGDWVMSACHAAAPLVVVPMAMQALVVHDRPVSVLAESAGKSASAVQLLAVPAVEDGDAVRMTGSVAPLASPVPMASQVAVVGIGAGVALGHEMLPTPVRPVGTESKVNVGVASVPRMVPRAPGSPSRRRMPADAVVAGGVTFLNVPASSQVGTTQGEGAHAIDVSVVNVWAESVICCQMGAPTNDPANSTGVPEVEVPMA
jgi:hypothetical protein